MPAVPGTHLAQPIGQYDLTADVTDGAHTAFAGAQVFGEAEFGAA